MKIFAISGKSGSGKTIVGEYIKNYYDFKGNKCVITNISKYLKLMAQEVLGWDEKKEPKPRDFLQKIGMDYRKVLGEDVLVRRIVEDIAIYQINKVEYCVISDIRFPYEINFIKSKYPDATVIYVNGKESKLSIEQQKHISEIAMDGFKDFDYIIDNNKDKKDLENKVINILKEVDKDEH